MSEAEMPLILEPEDLIPRLQWDDLIIVDVGSEDSYAAGHVPGAIHVTPRELVDGRPPAPGKLPELEQLEQLFSRLGMDDNSTFVVYDDEGGGWAGRFIWTLDMIGQRRHSYLNGGIGAWRAAGGPITQDVPRPERKPVKLQWHPAAMMDKTQILARLGDDDFAIWDARSRDEYLGRRQTAWRNGHIPGATHCEWTELMDRNAHLRIREDAAEYLAKKGFSPDREIVTHCQSHHRSGLTYVVGKSLGFNIKGYPGSWGEWGNDPETPVESD